MKREVRDSGPIKRTFSPIEGRARDREKGIHMPNTRISPEQNRQQTEGVREKAEDSRHDAEPDRRFTEGHGISAESARNEAERSRRLAEEGSACDARLGFLGVSICLHPPRE